MGDGNGDGVMRFSDFESDSLKDEQESIDSIRSCAQIGLDSEKVIKASEVLGNDVCQVRPKKKRKGRKEDRWQAKNILKRSGSRMTMGRGTWDVGRERRRSERVIGRRD